MKLSNSLLCTAAAAAALALTGCVTQPTQNTAAVAPQSATTTATAATTAAAPTLASTAGLIMGNVLQANGGAAGLTSALGVPAAGSAANAAGVLTYCAQNSALNAAKAGTLTNQLLTSLGLPTATSATAPINTQNQSYLNGIAGLVVAPNGQLFNLDQIKGNAKDKACEFVMDKAKAFL